MKLEISHADALDEIPDGFLWAPLRDYQIKDTFNDLRTILGLEIAQLLAVVPFIAPQQQLYASTEPDFSLIRPPRNPISTIR